MSEAGYGVALLDDCKYGHDLHRGALRLTLLKAANYPDPDADRGDHRFTYSLFPHAGDPIEGDVVGEAARLNHPVVSMPGSGAEVSMLSAVAVTDPAVVITAVKRAEDGSGDIIVRCYESAGGRCSTTMTTAFETSSLTVCDLLERTLDEEAGAATLDGGEIRIRLRPFQILTVRLSAR